MIEWVFIDITGNEVFDLYFNIVSFFAVSGWSIALVISMIRRLFR